MWIKFANLCRKNDRLWLAEKTINSLTQPDHTVGLGSPETNLVLIPVTEKQGWPSRRVCSAKVHVGKR